MERQRIETETDIVISGAGIAGMVLAALLARRGWRVVICDPAPPPEAADAAGSDLRSTAYLAPSVELLKTAGLWTALSPHATDLGALRVVDTKGWPPRLTEERTFRPNELDLEAFGKNVPNWRARHLIAQTLERDDRIDLRLGVGFASMLARDDAVLVRLSDGSRIRARLLVGADGRASPVRDAAGIDATIRRYGQKAFAFAVRHDRPHENVSTEIYNAGGAFTTVPLADHEGGPASAIVWMNDGRRGLDLMEMGEEDFARELNLRALGLLGRMTKITEIRLWPVITQTARRLTARRVALVAEAAHVLPPIGAQGLNTSLADIAALDAALADGDPGAPQGLDRYAAARERDVAVRARVIDAFNRICQSDGEALQSLRLTGLRAVHDIAPIRRRVMGAGLRPMGTAL
ncbi:FAD-dependent monooxygenase [Palleronia aestuarii]|nr:FAD-dependent monooxygenase [Palleronia aestuarii]